MKTISYLIILLFIYTNSIFAEEIKFEIYQVNPNSSDILIASGKKGYSASNFLITPRYYDNVFYGTKKELELAQGFTIGITETYEHPLKGFGLWIDRMSISLNNNGFSWEWFEKVSDGHFKKLQGGSLINVKTDMISLVQEELSQVIFLSDTKMEYEENICNDKLKEKRKYIIIIKAGSILKFPSIPPKNKMK